MDDDVTTVVLSDIASTWWVCQGGSYNEDAGKKFLWAPFEGKGGITRSTWATIKAVKKGDIIFNYASGALQGISIARDRGFDYINTDSSAASKEGTRVDIEHYAIDPIPVTKIKAHVKELSLCLAGKLGPFEKDGSVKQGYLFEFDLEAAKIIRSIYGKPFPNPIEDVLSPKCRPVSDLALKKRQIILYGPPGTGKTFRTKRIAIDIIKA